MHSIGSHPPSTFYRTGLQRGDEIAWHAFDCHVRPILRRFAARQGLTSHDADEAAQQTISEFARAVIKGRYQREKGRVKNYVFTIARRHIYRVRQRDMTYASDAVLDSIPTSPAVVSDWEHVWREGTLAHCLSLLQSTEPELDYRAFELRYRFDQPVSRIAVTLELSPQDVSKRVFRVKSRLRELCHDHELDD